VNRGAVFIFRIFADPSLDWPLLPHPACERAMTGPPFREPNGSSKQQSHGSKVNVAKVKLPSEKIRVPFP
jgi:hypothetical protein